MTRLIKIDPSKNQYRFYHLHVQPGLFGDISVVREWGRIGRPGTVRMDWFAHMREAEKRLEQKTLEKLNRGYSRRDVAMNQK